MSEMVKRVARVFYEAAHRELTDSEWDDTWAWHTSETVVGEGGEWPIASKARSAIATMREPTWEMITAARRVQITHPNDFEDEKGYFAQAYKYMIDEALKG